MPGQGSRDAAIQAVSQCLSIRKPLDGILNDACRRAGIAGRDWALARAITGTVFRRLGQIDLALSQLLDRPLPEKAHYAQACLRVGAAQILYMNVPDHAAVSASVSAAGADRRSQPYKRLVNGVLRSLIRQRDELLAQIGDDGVNCPEWLQTRWRQTYGETGLAQFIAAHSLEPSLDISVKSDPNQWAERFGGVVIGGSSVRFMAQGRIEELDGFADGAWWVQDAAAALPARLLGDVAGLQVADLCAAPGGKSAQLAATGAHVTAVDIAAPRLERLRENLDRLKLEATLVTADLLTWTPDQTFDRILLDAPCSATGTIRRHPDIAWLRGQKDIDMLAKLQSQLLERALSWLKPDGIIVYATCSLEPEEGEQQIENLLAKNTKVRREPITADEIQVDPAWIDPRGQLRTLPSHFPHDDPQMGGLDGFFAARLRIEG